MFSRSPMMNGDFLYETDPIRRLGDAQCVWTVVVAPARPVSGLGRSRVTRTVGDVSRSLSHYADFTPSHAD